MVAVCELTEEVAVPATIGTIKNYAVKFVGPIICTDS